MMSPAHAVVNTCVAALFLRTAVLRYASSHLHPSMRACCRRPPNMRWLGVTCNFPWPFLPLVLFVRPDIFSDTTTYDLSFDFVDLNGAAEPLPSPATNQQVRSVKVHEV